LSQRASVVGLKDCNGDARPELVINPYRVAADEFSLNFGGYNRKSAPEWTLLVEQQPNGEYAGATELSRAYASRLCPEKVTTPFDADALRWPSRLHCAKLWGAPEARLVTELARACERPRDEAAEQACRYNRSALERMVKTTLALQLSPSAAPALPPGCFDQPSD
jgi:hypothetical protein